MVNCIAGHFHVSITRTRGPFGALVDASSWMNDQGYELPEDYPLRIQIQEAGIDKTINMPTTGALCVSPVVAGRLEDIPDGIVRFSTESCGVPYESVSIYAANLRYEIDKMLAHSGTDKARSLSLKLDSDFLKMECLASIGQIEKAASFYRMIKDQVTRVDGHSRLLSM